MQYPIFHWPNGFFDLITDFNRFKDTVTWSFRNGSRLQQKMKKRSKNYFKQQVVPGHPVQVAIKQFESRVGKQ